MLQLALGKSGLQPFAAIAATLPVILNQVFNSACNFVLTIALVRLLGLAEFGHFTIYFIVAQSAVAFLAAALVMPAVSIAASENGESRRGLLSTAGALVGLGLLVGIGVIGLVQLGLTATDNTHRLLLLPFAALFATMVLNDFARRLLLFNRELTVVWVFDVLRFGALGSMLFWLGNFAGPQAVSSAMLVLAIAYAIALAGLAVVSLPTLSAITLAGFSHWARRIARTGKWLSASAALQLVDDNIFILVGSAVVGTEAVGLVRTGQTLIGVVHPLFLALEHILPRRIGEMASRYGWHRALQEYARLATAVAGGMLLIMAGLAILAQPLLALTVGAEAASHAWVMQALCGIWVPYLLFSMLTFPLRAVERTRAIALSLTATVLVALVIVLPLVQHFGIAGILAGMAIAQIVSAGLLALQYAKVRREFVQ
ncbi:polysaccharide biosynthesis C-terminal domain-containing protein [Devosia sp.]|uniref:lipopolysaccharide biosynthesis protein n=1 Tax=Devosia sp. TaxID=1871048 RepID=UPI002635450D|nr:polysaccharide biosynthesis C-terminal domain-containing protein [Devosia sp.]